MNRLISNEEEIKEYIERYQELIAEYKHLMEAVDKIFPRLEKINKEVNFVQEKLEKDGIKFTEYETLEDFNKTFQDNKVDENGA